MRTIKVALGNVYANPSQQYLLADSIESAVRMVLLDEGFRAADAPGETPVDLEIDLKFSEGGNRATGV